MARSAPTAFDWNNDVTALLVIASTLWLARAFDTRKCIHAKKTRKQTYCHYGKLEQDDLPTNQRPAPDAQNEKGSLFATQLPKRGYHNRPQHCDEMNRERHCNPNSHQATDY